MRNSIGMTLGAVLWFGLLPNVTHGYTPPLGFSKIQSAIGVELYKKDGYSGGRVDYVQVINLSKGASLKLLFGPKAGGWDEVDQKYCGVGSPTFNRQTLEDAWKGFTTSYSNAFSITNGQFFDPNKLATGLAFPVKKDDTVVSDGYGQIKYPEYLGEKIALRLWRDYADIVSFDDASGSVVCASSSAPNVIVGLTEYANKTKNDSQKRPIPTARTFIGVLDDNFDGKNEIVLIFNSNVALQPEAATVLRSFGATQVMMLDGGGSSGMIYKGASYLKPSRSIPQTIGVTSGLPSQIIDTFADLYWWFFGEKSGGNYPCPTSITCQDFRNGTRIAVRNSDGGLWYYFYGSWNWYGYITM